MNAPVTAKVRIMALGWMLLSALIIVLTGCRAAPPPEVQRELTEQFQTVPALPDSKEIGRRFIRDDYRQFYLEVTYAIAKFPFSDYDYMRSWGDGVWKYQGSHAEKVAHRYVKDGWLLTIKPSSVDGRAILLLRCDP